MAQQPTQVIGPSTVRPNGQTFLTAKQNTQHPTESDATKGGTPADKGNCANTEVKSSSLPQPTTSTAQTNPPTSGGQATSTSEHKDMTVPANDKTTQKTTLHQDAAVQTDNLPEAQS